jgi:hypothetical protein
MDMAELIAQFVFACVAFVYLVVLCVQMVVYAKTGSGGAHVLGAVFILMGFGNMQDPTMEMAARAKEERRHEEDDSGDPPASGSKEKGGASRRRSRPAFPGNRNA